MPFFDVDVITDEELLELYSSFTRYVNEVTTLTLVSYGLGITKEQIADKKKDAVRALVQRACTLMSERSLSDD
jgi:hypothetical protein